jgi:hypothetical protein
VDICPGLNFDSVVTDQWSKMKVVLTRNLGRMDVVEGLGLAYKDSIARREAWRASGVGPEPKNLMKTDPLGLMLLLTDLAYLNMVLNPRPRQQYTYKTSADTRLQNVVEIMDKIREGNKEYKSVSGYCWQ